MIQTLQKFGGSSIANADRIRHVGNIIREKYNEQGSLAVVVSALKGVTDSLIELAERAANKQNTDAHIEAIAELHKTSIAELVVNSGEVASMVDALLDELVGDINAVFRENMLHKKALDKILSYGERLSSIIIAAYLNETGIPAEALDARKVVLTDDTFGNAYVHYQRSYNRIRNYCKDRKKLQIITGFLGATEDGETTTLGRSGSDYTAAIFGAALNAKTIEIWTDVPGIMSANPSVIKDAETISYLTYEEAMELAHAGAKVIFPPTMIPALYKKIPIHIKNTFDPKHPGSIISHDRPLNGNTAVGISSLSHVSLIRLQGAGMVGMKGLVGRIFSCLAKKEINIILISQAFSEHSICFALQPDMISIAEKTLRGEFEFELSKRYIDRIIVENELSLVAVVGEKMRNTPGIAGRLFGILGEENINVIAIAQGSSERNISFIVHDDFVEKTLKALHKNFFNHKAVKD